MISKKIFSLVKNHIRNKNLCVVMSAPKASATKSHRLFPWTAENVENARRGIVLKTDRNGNVVSSKQIPPYYNKVTGSAGKDHLQLAHNSFHGALTRKSKAGPRVLIFVPSLRLVGTEAELREQLRSAGASEAQLNDLLSHSRTINAETAVGSMKALLDDEVSVHKSFLASQKKQQDVIDADLDLVYQLHLDRAAERGKPKASKTPKSGDKSTRGSSRGSLIDRYNALEGDKVLDVSKMTAAGTAAKTRDVPGAGSLVKNLASGRFPKLYSNSADTYTAALRAFGLDAATAENETRAFRASLASAPVAAAAAVVPPQPNIASFTMPVSSGVRAAPASSSPSKGSLGAVPSSSSPSRSGLGAVPSAALPRNGSPLLPNPTVPAPARINTPTVPALGSPRGVQVPAFGTRM